MLTDIEYREVKERIRVLEGIMEGAGRDKENYDQMKKAAQAKKEDAEARLFLYINFLKDAIEEYEAAHPPEEIE